MDLSTVVPWAGLGDLHFGETRDEVRHRLGARYESFRKVPGEPLTDAYDDLGFHLYYDQRDQLVGIEAFPPCSPTYNDIRLMGDEPVFVVEQLRKTGHQPRWEEPSYFFDSLGLALYVPYDSIEAVTLFRKDDYK